MRIAVWGTAVALAAAGSAVIASSASDHTWRPPPADAKFDYQIGGDYPPPRGVGVVSRDWFSGAALAGTYSICYVNAFQTQDDEAGVERPDERSAWPRDLVLRELGDDPGGAASTSWISARRSTADAPRGASSR